MMHRNTSPPGSPRVPGSRQKIYQPKSWMRNKNFSHAVLAATPTDERCMHHHETRAKSCEDTTRQYLRALRTGDLERLKDVPRTRSGKTVPRMNLHWWDIAPLDRMAGVTTWKRTKIRKDWEDGKDMSLSLSEVHLKEGGGLDEEGTFELDEPPELPPEPEVDESVDEPDNMIPDGSKADKKKHGLTPELCIQIQQKMLDALTAVMQSHDMTQEDAMARIVKKVDKDGSNCLNYNEFIKLIRSMKVDVKTFPEKQAKLFFTALDPDGGGSIDTGELLAFAQFGSGAFPEKKKKKKKALAELNEGDDPVYLLDSYSY